MRITIEPTVTDAAAGYHTVAVSTPNDELRIDEVLRLISNALMAYGFHSDTVRDYLREVAERE